MEGSIGTTARNVAILVATGLCALAGAAPADAGRAVRPQEEGSPDDLPVVRVEHDDTRVDRSCRLVFPDEPVLDANGDGVVHVVGNDLVVVCEGRLRGAAPGTRPDAYEGVGIVLRGQRNELTAPRVSGFRVGIRVERSFAAHVVDADVSDNRRQHLGSTWEREDGADWLWPHRNDEGEWAANYGAGLLVHDSRGTDVVRLVARDVQNGIVLDRATNSSVIGCDASFLSGWGLALWRSCDNRIVGNRFDFCVRGYAHGRYNRGQDSAGVLLFEQSSRNRFEANSITHGGDGVFGFAGREALGEEGADVPGFDHERSGCNANTFESNDLSFAAAHGLELTFSFDTLVRGCLFERNAICGIWYGYGRDSQFTLDRFVGNGEAGYGAERGGVCAEHGQRLSFSACSFEDNALDLRFWTDADPNMAELPWVRANGRGARDNYVCGNLHDGEGPRMELDGAARTVTDLADDRIAADDESRASIRRLDGDKGAAAVARTITAELLERVRTGALRARGVEPLDLGPRPRGREYVVIGEWGPYDWSQPMLQPLERGPSLHRYRLLGPEGTALDAFELTEGGDDVVATVERAEDGPVGPDGIASAVVTIRPARDGTTARYAFRARSGASEFTGEGVLLGQAWDVRFARWTVDPREDASELDAALDEAPSFRVPELRLDFGGGRPVMALRALGVDTVGPVESIGAERFGTLARTSIELPAGTWRIATLSDDGIRVLLDGEVVVDDWTWHGPTEHDAEFTLAEPREVELEVRHFELDGHAVLHVVLEPVRVGAGDQPSKR
ncbi:MAG: right-handed parallel beta-helix repeat-containing protein [Planctomycetota bacterium]